MTEKESYLKINDLFLLCLASRYFIHRDLVETSYILIMSQLNSVTLFILLSFLLGHVTAWGSHHPAATNVMTNQVCLDGHGCIGDISLVNTALHSIQQDLHQMIHALNFTKRHHCVNSKATTNDSGSVATSICLKAKVLTNLLKEAEELAGSLDIDTYYSHRQRFTSHQLASLFLQSLGLIGSITTLGYILYYVMGGLMVTGVLLVDIIMDLPQALAKIMYFPFILVGEFIYS